MREDIEWFNFWIEDANIERRRILLIGDSVSRQYRKWLNIFLDKKYVVDLLAMSYGILDCNIQEEIEHYLETIGYSYEIIIYNLGTHHGYDIKCDEDVTHAQKFMEKTIQLIRLLKKYCNKVIAVSGTPENESLVEANHNKEIIARNNILQDISNKEGCQYIDIYHDIQKSKFQYVDWCHFNEDANIFISKSIIKKICRKENLVNLKCIVTLQEFFLILENSVQKKYIYGKGKHGKILKAYLNRMGIDVEGYIVSDEYYDNQKDTYKINEVENMDILVLVTPMEVKIWKLLSENNINYFSLAKSLYIFMEEYINAYEIIEKRIQKLS